MRNPSRVSPGLRADQRGGIYVEHIVVVAVGLLIAVIFAEAGTLLVYRFERVSQVLYSGVP